MKLREILAKIVKPDGPFTQEQAHEILKIPRWRISAFKRAADDSDHEKLFQDILKLIDEATVMGIDVYAGQELRPLTADEMRVYLLTKMRGHIERGELDRVQEIMKILERNSATHGRTSRTVASHVEPTHRSAHYGNSNGEVSSGADGDRERGKHSSKKTKRRSQSTDK